MEVVNLVNQYDWLFPPIVCGLLAVYCNVILGRQVLKRGIIFIDLAMAQVAALGVLITDNLFHNFVHQHAWPTYLGATLLTGLAALLIAQLERYKVKHLEALIGALYVLSACLAIMLVSDNPHGNVLVKQLLQGQMLWINWSQVGVLLAFSAFLYALCFYRPQFIQGRGFYLVFALAIPLLIQTLGVYLEFAMLVIPAVAASYFLSSQHLLVASFIASTGLITGLLVSLIWDLPSGPSVVLMICAMAFLTSTSLIVLNRFKPRY